MNRLYALALLCAVPISLHGCLMEKEGVKAHMVPWDGGTTYVDKTGSVLGGGGSSASFSMEVHDFTVGVWRGSERWLFGGDGAVAVYVPGADLTGAPEDVVEFSGNLVSLDAFDANGDGTSELYIGMEEGTDDIVLDVPGKQTWITKNFIPMTIADWDGDGAREVIGAYGQTWGTSQVYPQIHYAMGTFKRNSDTEIQVIYFDGVTVHHYGFDGIDDFVSASMAAGDVDGDGVTELVTLHPDSKLTIFKVVAHPYGPPPGFVYDVDTPCAEGVEQGINCLYKGLELMSQPALPATGKHWVRGLAVEDMDGDGRAEIYLAEYNGAGEETTAEVVGYSFDAGALTEKSRGGAFPANRVFAVKRSGDRIVCAHAWDGKAGVR